MTTVLQGQLVQTDWINQWAPPGVISMYAGATAPDGWLLCDGSAVSRTTYADLFTAIGTTYGAGDGSTTFNVPDVRGRVPVGRSPGGKAEVDALGDNEGVAATSRSISHHHTANQPNSPVVTFSQGGNQGGVVTVSSGAATSGDSANTDKPAYLVLNFIIRAKDV